MDIGLRRINMEKYLCPELELDCPYDKDGICTIGNPMEECDDYYFVNGDDEEDNEIYVATLEDLNALI